jgi:thiol-disulfide isomerase/thioredoxin
MIQVSIDYMKQIFVFLFFLSFASTAQNFTISGKVHVPIVRHIMLSYYEDFNLRHIEDSIVLDADRSFTYELRMEEKGKFCYIGVGGDFIEIWAVPGQHLIVEIRPDKKVVFSGALSKVQEYLQIQSDYWAELFDSARSKNHLLDVALSKPLTDEYFQAHELLTTKRIQHLRNFLKETTDLHTQAFITRQSQDLIFTDLYYKLTSNSPDLQKFQFYSDRFNLHNNETNDFQRKYEFTQTNPFNNSLYLRSQRFLAFSNQFLTHVAVKAIRENALSGEEHFLRAVFDAIDQFVADPEGNAVHKAYFLQNRFKSFENFGLPEETALVEYANYIARLEEQHPPIGCIIRDDFNLAVYQLNQFVGYPAPPIQLKDDTGSAYFFASENGSIVYLKVWASWCRPCIEQIPSWNKLMEKFRSNPQVSFIMISIDASEDKWLKALAKFRPAGRQLISPGDFKESELVKKYKIYSLPSHIIIGKDGKILEPRAPHPDEKRIRQLLLRS